MLSVNQVDNDFCAVGRVFAVVVAFFPDGDFERRLEILLPQVDALLVVDNTPGGVCARRLENLFIDKKCCSVIEMGENVGVGRALNLGLEHAVANDCNWLLTMDQDSRCYPDMVRVLRSVARSCSFTPAVIGGNYLDLRNGKLKVTVGSEKEWYEQKTVITSGSLVDVEFATQIGGFREDYFIDQLDHEYCLRSRSYRRRVVISRKPVMEHSVGEAGGPYMPLIGFLPGQSPLRKYYVARNSIVTVGDYLFREPVWCLLRFFRLFLGFFSMVLFEKGRVSKIRAFWAGMVDGVRRNMGPCRQQ